MSKFKLNGKSVSLDTDEKRTLLWVLRGDMQLTGTKYGCGIGACGACTVVVDGEAKRSCQTSLADVNGKSVTTVEGLEVNGKLTPLQQAFIDQGAFQCGFCTSGMLMNAHALLKKNAHPTRAQIVEEMDGNLCRCGAHQGIVNAIAEVAK
jgi:nicotinate dehydrogenase subunit A